MKDPEYKEIPSPNIPEEMRAASKGSFPLSPGVMAGHYAVANLYWHFRQEILNDQTILTIFGKSDPEPPQLTLPGGHRHVDTNGLNVSVWKNFLDIAFTTRPIIDPIKGINTLLEINAESDDENFMPRLQGQKSKLLAGNRPTPSLLRAFLYENAFPEKNPFFTWLFEQMRQELSSTLNKTSPESTCKSALRRLISKWDSNYPNEKFIPEKFIPKKQFPKRIIHYKRRLRNH